MKNTAIVILAAGSSSRFGSSKQLLRLKNKTLLQHVIDEAVASGAASVIVVTGANAALVSKSINQDNVQLVLNENWQEGMAGSIGAGVNAAIALEKIKKIIITVSDQPFVTSALFELLNQMQSKSGKPIVACTYADTIGTPVLFGTKYFDLLVGLKGDEGAKKIIQNNAEDVATVDFPQGEIDIDTQKDYEYLTGNQENA